MNEDDAAVLNKQKIALKPVLQAIQERGFIRCRADPLEVSQNEGFSLDLVRFVWCWFL